MRAVASRRASGSGRRDVRARRGQIKAGALFRRLCRVCLWEFSARQVTEPPDKPPAQTTRRGICLVGRAPPTYWNKQSDLAHLCLPNSSCGRCPSLRMASRARNLPRRFQLVRRSIRTAAMTPAAITRCDADHDAGYRRARAGQRCAEGSRGAEGGTHVVPQIRRSVSCSRRSNGSAVSAARSSAGVMGSVRSVTCNGPRQRGGFLGWYAHAHLLSDRHETDRFGEMSAKEP